MSASLVGSEMCIRDRVSPSLMQPLHPPTLLFAPSEDVCSSSLGVCSSSLGKGGSAAVVVGGVG
eukprot:3845216-Alexandrium_andersonii.AAC.1